MVITTLTAQSRFPRIGDYDRAKHEYSKSYLRPSGYKVALSVCADLPFEKFTAPPQPPLNRPLIVDHWITPDDVRAYRWTLKHQDGTVASVRTTGAKGWVPCKASVVLPKPGHYQVDTTEELTNGRKRTSVSSWDLRDDLVICLGDSCASGQGNPDNFGSPTAVGRAQCANTKFQIKAGWPGVSMSQDPFWIESMAYRSFKSGHALGVKKAERPSSGRVITFLTFATSGAETEAGLLRAQHAWQRPRGGQIEEAAHAIGGRRPAVVLLSIGGNDVGFSSGLEGLASDWRGGGRKRMVEATEEKILALPPKLKAVNERMRKMLQPRTILLTEYPEAFFDAAGGGQTGGCGVFSTALWMQIDGKDAAAIAGLANKLNKTLREAAKENKWIFVDGVVAGFAGHGYCSSLPFFVGAEESCRRQGDHLGTMHPNWHGHQVYERCVSKHLSAALAAV
jgi:lysophospholipase L1-like esterase